jgi:hypothetical protein
MAMTKEKQTKARKRMKEAVASLQHYMATYDKQYGYQDYPDTTYINDVLYGLGRSLDRKYEFADGFDRFKDVLRKHLDACRR